MGSFPFLLFILLCFQSDERHVTDAMEESALPAQQWRPPFQPNPVDDRQSPNDKMETANMRNRKPNGRILDVNPLEVYPFQY